MPQFFIFLKKEKNGFQMSGLMAVIQKYCCLFSFINNYDIIRILL